MIIGLKNELLLDVHSGDILFTPKTPRCTKIWKKNFSGQICKRRQSR